MKTIKTTGQSGIQLFFVFLLLLLFSIPTMAQNRAQSYATFVNNTDQKATDLHIEFRNGATRIATNPPDYTVQEPQGTFKIGDGSGENHWDLAAGNGLGVAKGGSVTLYWTTTGSAAVVKNYTWTNDNNLEASTGVIANNYNREGRIQCSNDDSSAGDGSLELTVANETFIFDYPPALSGEQMATSIADFIENEIEYLNVSSIEDNIVIFNSSYLSEPVDNFTCNINPDSIMATEFKWIPEVIPTLTQWGVIILLLLVLAIGMVFIYQRQTSLAVAGVSESSTVKPRLFDGKLFTKVFAVVLLIGAAGLMVAYLYFGSITNADPFGTVVSAGIVAYMAHLWIMKKS